MDIVSRLKMFMTSLKFANSQFADTCRIPRPTISQILNGRNKKISDELISKIHEAYPQLSVMWLMFGEGDMLTDSNFKISEPKKGDNVDFGNNQHAVNESIVNQLDFDSIVQEDNSDNFSMQSKSQSNQIEQYNEVEKVVMTKPIEKTSMSVNTSSASKRVIEIRVFYNDNSYEIFVPQSQIK